MHQLDTNKTNEEKARQELYKNAIYCFEQILVVAFHKKNSSFMATYFLSHKPFNLDEQIMLGTAREVKTNS